MSRSRTNRNTNGKLRDRIVVWVYHCGREFAQNQTGLYRNMGGTRKETIAAM